MAPPSLKPKVLNLIPSIDVACLPKKENRGRGTVKSIAQQIGVVDQTVTRHLRALHSEKKIHVANWHRGANGFVAVWALGNFPDAEQPQPRSVAAISKMYRRRVKKAVANAREGKAYDDAYRHKVARAMANDVASRTRINPQHWLSALGL